MKRLLFILLCIVTSYIANAQIISIYGGPDKDKFLGYLNASPYNSESIWNQFSPYGNEYNSDSIWNGYGTYGNEYSSYSPWNAYSSYSPILVDDDGNYYGEFNINNHNKAVKMICKLAKSIINGDLELDDAYEIIFE